MSIFRQFGYSKGMTKTILQAKELTKKYADSVWALQNISLQIQEKEIYGIIGLSGAGKSTLLRSLAGLIAPSSGSVLFHESDISKLKGSSLRQFRLKMGMVFQHFNLLSSRTVAGNIAYALEVAGVPRDKQINRIDELLKLVGLLGKKEVYPAFLSGGEKQRVGIARALANQPEILFCDEATSALDPRTTREILDLLTDINKKLGLTIVLITHDMEVIKRICHRVAVLEGGKIVEEGLVDQVFGDPQHLTTQHFIQGISHEIPEDFFHPPSPSRKLMRLRFKGGASGKPLISQIVRKYDVDANILLGWLDRLKTATVGTLVVEFTGSPEKIAGALDYLSNHSVVCEVLQNDQR